jgi:sugar/nucleoside kinase (ribokinase family)
MSVDVLILNTVVVDFRCKNLTFIRKLAGKGGLAKCKTEDMPDIPQKELKKWINDGSATAGGPGNSAPLIAKTGLKVAIGANLGKGDYDGLDAQGRFFYDTMAKNNVDMSQIFIHPDLPTGTTFIDNTPVKDRGGIVYFPNANNDFNFEIYKKAVEKLKPGIVYYMYSGLSDRGDANNGQDLADFIKWCRDKGAVTIADSHTLTKNPKKLAESGQPIDEYYLLEPLLPELDIFFTSGDEAQLIGNTLAGKRHWNKFTQDENNTFFLNFLFEKFHRQNKKTKLFGITVNDGAFEKHSAINGAVSSPSKIKSPFIHDEVVDLVGAGDSFRAGLISYIAKNLSEFKKGSMNLAEAVQMGNLFASLYIKAPLDNRYADIKTYDKMLKILRQTVKD